jgi:hypothetical protein
MAYFKVLSRQLYRAVRENHGLPQTNWSSGADFKPGAMESLQPLGCDFLKEEILENHENYILNHVHCYRHT